MKKSTKNTIAEMGVAALFGLILLGAVLLPSGAFQSDEAYIKSHPEIYREDGNWREDWAKYLAHPEVYEGKCLVEE